MKIIDNYLPKEDLEALQHLIVWNKIFPFFLGQGVANGEDINSDFNNWYAAHVLYVGSKPTEYFNHVFDLLNFKSKILLKLKVNFYPHTNVVYEHAPHVDYPFPCRAGLLSLNTCDGFTRLADGTKVDSVANRMLFFEGGELHNSSTTTDSGRFNININYL